MSKVGVIAEGTIVINEVLETVSDFFSEAVSKDFYEILNKFAFLSTEFLEFNSSGDFVGKTKIIAEAVQSLSGIFLWGCFLFYGFNCLFSYFISKKVDLPWKAFVRIVIFAVLINASSFICFSGVFFSQNVTAYLREMIGTDAINFEIFESAISEIKIDENSDVFDLKVLANVVSYFSLFIISILLGIRFIFLKILIILLPLFLCFGALRCTEKIFFMWGKGFFGILFIEVVICLMLAIVSALNLKDAMVLSILICAIQVLLSKVLFELIGSLLCAK